METETKVAVYGGYTYRVGDRVVLTEDHPDSNDELFAGDTGVIVVLHGIINDEPWIGVRWDKQVNGHSIDGRCDYGYGWNVSAENIRPEKEAVISDEVYELITDEASLMEFLGLCV